MLILIRHAMPAFGPASPPDEWELGEEGRRGAESLRSILPRDAVLVAGAEPKMRQTLAVAGPVATDERFNEVARDEPFDGDFRARRRAYVEGIDHDGWEARGLVAARFDAGVREHLDRTGEKTLVVATGGMVMTVWLTTLGLDDPGGFWADLRLPDVFAVDLDGPAVGRIESSALVQVGGFGSEEAEPGRGR